MRAFDAISIKGAHVPVRELRCKILEQRWISARRSGNNLDNVLDLHINVASLLCAGQGLPRDAESRLRRVDHSQAPHYFRGGW